jgi:hypothetical protein
MNAARDMGQKFGEELERYRVVAWLRERSHTAKYKDQRLCAIEIANELEAGEHLKGPPAE